MRERDIEAYLVEQVVARGGVAEKFKSVNKRNVPDRIISWPEDWNYDCEPRPAFVHFVECKATGEKPTPAQLRDHERRRAMGFLVVVVDSYEAVDKYLEVYGP